MGDIFTNITQVPTSSSAFLIYRPQSTSTKEMVFYNKEAWQILSMSDSYTKKASLSFAEICSICSKWKELLEKGVVDTIESKKRGDLEGYFIELIKSGRRLYGVRGVILLGHQQSFQKSETTFMFLFVRVCSDNVNLPMIFRQWKLSNREKDIVRLLLEEKSNKEIASALGLSIDTVKGYMKLLMRKLGVTSRTGIIACLLTKRRPNLSQMKK